MERFCLFPPDPIVHLLFHRLMVLFDRLIDSFGSCDCLLTRVAPIPRIRSLICAPVGWRLVLGAWANHYISALWICAKSMTTAMLSHDADFWMKPLAHSTGHLPGLDRESIFF